MILNVPSDWKIGFVKLPLDFKHWILLKEINGSVYNLDSKLTNPEKLGGHSDLEKYLQERILSEAQTQVLLVVEPAVEASGSWLKPMGGEVEGRISDNGTLEGGDGNTASVAVKMEKNCS